MTDNPLSAERIAEARKEVERREHMRKTGYAPLVEPLSHASAETILAALALAPELTALRARAEAAEKDAERYRWLRDRDFSAIRVTMRIDADTDELLFDEDLDAAIDRARGAGGEAEDRVGS